MKASEIIQLAFEDHYKCTRNAVAGKEMFMCHAITNVVKKTTGLSHLDAMEKAIECTKHFMPELDKQNTSCLTNYLKRTDSRYQYYSTRFDDYTPYCIKMRAKFWSDLIESLKEKGL